MLGIAFRLDLPHGRCVGVEIPETIDDAALPPLHAEERAFAAGLAPARRPAWVAGRHALRTALGDLGFAITAPILATPRGAPVLPPGALGSISHKRTLAVALAAPSPAENTALGIDIELDAPPRIDISRRILTPTELAAIQSLPDPTRARSVLLHLSAKESIYKALDRFVARYVSFQEAELTFSDDGTAQATLHLIHNEGPFTTEASWTTVPGHVLTTVRITSRPR